MEDYIIVSYVLVAGFLSILAYRRLSKIAESIQNTTARDDRLRNGGKLVISTLDDSIEFDNGNFKITAELTSKGLEIKKMAGKSGYVGLKIYTKDFDSIIIN